MLDEIRNRAEQSMEKALEHLRHELATIRTGKASPALLDVIHVEYFGSKVPLKQVATIAAPEPRLLTVQPWDKSIIPEIEKAIQASELGLNPQNDGSLIRIPIPPLTEERRRDLVKVVRRMGEECKIAVRNARRDANDRIRKLEKSHEVSEDDARKAHDEVQKITDRFVEKVDEIVAAKEKEVMEI